MKKILKILSVIIILFYGCTSQEAKIIQQFKTNKEAFDNIIEVALKDSYLNNNKNQLFSTSLLSSELIESINELEIGELRYVVMEYIDCDEKQELKIEIIFNGNWHLEYYECPHNIIQQGDYMEKGFIESWGLDENWYLWVNNDFVG